LREELERSCKEKPWEIPTEPAREESNRRERDEGRVLNINPKKTAAKINRKISARQGGGRRASTAYSIKSLRGIWPVWYEVRGWKKLVVVQQREPVEGCENWPMEKSRGVVT